MPNNFSCDVLRWQTNQIINYATLAYPRNKANERFEKSPLNNIINGKMSNILGVPSSGNISSGNSEYIYISDWASWADISQMKNPAIWSVGQASKTEPKLIEKANPEEAKQNNILNNLKSNSDHSDSSNNGNNWWRSDWWSILDNLTHDSANIYISWDLTIPNDILWKLEYIKNIITNNIINDKSIVDKWICEYIYEQVKIRQSHPEFLISSIVLLFAILYPFFRFLFYIVGFVWRVLLLILCKLWLYNISIYYEKVEKIE